MAATEEKGSVRAATKAPPGLWVGQRLHGLCLAGLLVLVWVVWAYLGQPAAVAFWTAVAVPVVHQVFVWLAWRLELRSAAISKTIGFQGYVAIFFLLFGGRFLSLIAVGWLDRGSLGLAAPLQAVYGVILGSIGIYAGYGVGRYFGYARAAGADHFDPRYRRMPLVTEGIFRFTRNGMYIFAFLLFWAIAAAFNSAAALTVAAFAHAYIWVHYHATERPDMEFLYASGE